MRIYIIDIKKNVYALVMTKNVHKSDEQDYTVKTRETLEQWFASTVDGIYFAHQPIYGFRTPYASTSNIGRYMITKSILNAVGRYECKNFIDVGGAEGYTANLVREIFKVPVMTTDLSETACEMARKIFNIDAKQSDIHNLPFSNESFDTVLCSETIEHVADYKKAIVELLRITRNVLIITVPHETPEIVAANIRNKAPHGHIHYFDVHTLDYLKQEGYQVAYKKTLSPLLVIPRIIIEGYRKNEEKWHYRIYNRLTPLFKKVFGIGSANRMVDADDAFCSLFGSYGGITFTIIKTGYKAVENPEIIKARNFTGIKTGEYVVAAPLSYHSR